MEEAQNPEVAALNALCEKHGGFKAIAAAIGANDQSLYQILSGVSLPSGRAKGIGPKLRDKLNKYYPGWNSSEPAPLVDEMPARLKAALATVAGLLRSIPEDQWGTALLDIAEVLQKDRRL